MLAAIASEAGLEVSALRRAIGEERYTALTAGERERALRLGIRGVPAIAALAPGETAESPEAEIVCGAYPDAALQALVERARRRASAA